MRYHDLVMAKVVTVSFSNAALSSSALSAASTPERENSHMFLKPGILFDRDFILSHHIGSGTYGSVWAARRVLDDELSSPTIALKVFDRHVSLTGGVKCTHSPGTSRDDYAVELDVHKAIARQAVPLTHTHIATVLESGIDSLTDFHYLTFEYVPDPTLQEFLCTSHDGVRHPNFVPQSPDMTRFIAKGLLTSVSFLHRLGFTHRDLSPSNMFVTNTGVKLCDLGMSCSSTIPDDRVYVVNRWVRAPEIIMGMEQTQALDIWSVGVVLMLAVFARYVMKGKTNGDQLVQTLRFTGPMSRLQFSKMDNSQRRFYQAAAQRMELPWLLHHPFVFFVDYPVHETMTDPHKRRFCDMLLGMQNPDPQFRRSAESLLLDPFLVGQL
jgi:serine/threonine protein kinase